jgi:small-conductance mechanosensitive channel
LEQAALVLRTPLVNQAKSLAGRGDGIARQDSSDPTVLVRQKKELDTLTAQFKIISSAIVPLAEQGILIDLYQRNLSSWRSAVKAEYDIELKSLLVHLGILVLILISVFASGEVVRKAISRYIHDLHRRYQFLLMRKIVMACIIAAIILFSFAEQLGSVATFAGLLTAGVALALQSVIISIAGYFFLIGRFGIGVGDRVQISGVTGEVVEVGLVRLHLMELTPAGSPTGRVVAFANSVVFQSTAGLFKQIPGTSFAWHEVTITLAVDSDYLLVEKRLAPVVDKIYEQYRAEMEKQYREMERTVAPLPENAMKPRTRLRFTSSGLEVVLRFPVGIRNAAETDDLVTRELLKEIHNDPELRLAGSGPAVKLSTGSPDPNSYS